MDPIIIVPVALAVAWAATRKKKTSTKPKATTPTTPEHDLPGVDDEPELPSVLDDEPDEPEPVGPFEGPGGEEPWRPGGPNLPKPQQPEPDPFPSGGPKPPELGDPRPIDIYPGTTAEQIAEHEHAAYGLFISTDCKTVFEGELWLSDVFMPLARELVLGHPEMFHHPVAVMHELLINLGGTDDAEETMAEGCIGAWSEFVYGAFTPYGTYSGWIHDPHDEYWADVEWFTVEYPKLDQFLWDIYMALWDEPDLVKVFEADWPDDVPGDDEGIEFDPTGT